MSSGADSEAASQGMGTPSPPPSATIKTPGTKTSMGHNSIPSSPANNLKEKTGEYLNLGPFCLFVNVGLYPFHVDRSVTSFCVQTCFGLIWSLNLWKQTKPALFLN